MTSHASDLVGEDGGPLPSTVAADGLAARASASPVEDGLVTSTAAPLLASAPVEAADVPLAPLQQWFAAIVTHPDGINAGVAAARSILGDDGTGPLERLLKPGPRMSALARARVYHHAYHARLIECLADDYPGLQHLWGEDLFETVARRYIARHPSTDTNLNGFGRHFAGFLRTDDNADLPHVTLAAELATLEWAIVEVLHAPSAPVVSLEKLRQFPEARWGELTFSSSPTLRFHQFTFPVNRWFQQFRDDRSKTTVPSPEPSATAVYRESWTLWRMDFTPSMATVLQALVDGEPLGLALGRLDAGADPALEGNVMAWFQAWMAGGFFTDVTLGPSSD